MVLSVFKSINDLMPELLKPYNPTRAPWTMNQLLPQTLRSRLKSRGDGVFSVEAPDLILSCSKDLPSLLKKPYLFLLSGLVETSAFIMLFIVYILYNLYKVHLKTC